MQTLHLISGSPTARYAPWRDESIPWTARQALVGALFGNLLKERPREQMAQIVHDFILFGQGNLKDWAFVQYLGDWLRGHFIQIELP